MTLLGTILLDYYAAPSTYADEAIVAAVEALEKHADANPKLVWDVEMAIVKAGRISIPFQHVEEIQQLMKENA